MHEKILILDFGSQFTQLIARRLRELNVYCEIHPFNHFPAPDKSVKGIILSGSPASVYDKDFPDVDLDLFFNKFPVLGICYGAQLIAKKLGGVIERSAKREFGRAILERIKPDSLLFSHVNEQSQVWMSHGDSIVKGPEHFETIARSGSIDVAAFRNDNGFYSKPIYCIQFHPEVYHTEFGKQILENFSKKICDCKGDWTPASFIEESISTIKKRVGHDKVVMALSGGVDSTVAATLIHKAIDKNLYCVFVDNGLLRKNEFENVLHDYHNLGLNVKGIDARIRFLNALKNVSDPEQKRKIIGKTFIDVFDEEAHKIENVSWLGQGTIYPDVIESVSVHGPSMTIKSHHNVGGLPEKMKMKVLEPLRLLFKDEVRKIGKELNVPTNILERHPFPGPGLGIRVLGAITEEKVKLLQEADSIFIEHLRNKNWYDKVWQAGAVLLPVQSVGVMGDERTYEFVLALRAVTSTDGMTADWAHLPYEFLASVSGDIINRVKGINRVVYDISSKPPATIEWE
jgi:GMP synthase (glutamine-hydrolysing)